MIQQKIREWILKQDYMFLNPKNDGMTAWEIAGIIMKESGIKEKAYSNTDSFEKYLQEIHAKNYTGIDDDMPDAFDSWLGECDVEDFISFGESYGEILNDRCDLKLQELKEKQCL